MTTPVVPAAGVPPGGAPAAAPGGGAAPDPILGQPKAPAAPAGGAPKQPIETRFSKLAPEHQLGLKSKEWVTADGEIDDVKLAKGYFDLEAFKGAPASELFRLGKTADPEQLTRVHRYLGVPETAKDYGLKADESMDPKKLDEIGEFALKHNFTKSQLDAVLELNRSTLKAEREALTAQREQRRAADARALSLEWGDATKQNQEIARRSVEVLFPKEWNEGEGDDNVFRVLQNHPKVGPAGLAKFLHGLGVRLGEDTFVTGQPSGGGALTPDQAHAKIRSLLADPDYKKAYRNGDKLKLEEITALSKISAKRMPRD